MKVDEVANIAAGILMDKAKVRWTSDDHESNLNAAIREVVDLRPDAYTQLNTLQLVAGTEQSLGATGLYLQKILCNLGVDGLTPGRSPRPIDSMTLDAFKPDWRNDAADGVVKNFVTDPRTPRRFEVWPPQPEASHYVRVIQTEYPAVVVMGTSTDFPLGDQFINAAVHLSLYFGWQKAVGGDLNRSAYHRKEALQLLGLAGQSQTKTQE